MQNLWAELCVLKTDYRGLAERNFHKPFAQNLWAITVIDTICKLLKEQLGDLPTHVPFLAEMKSQDDVRGLPDWNILTRRGMRHDATGDELTAIIVADPGDERPWVWNVLSVTENNTNSTPMEVVYSPVNDLRGESPVYTPAYINYRGNLIRQPTIGKASVEVLKLAQCLKYVIAKPFFINRRRTNHVFTLSDDLSTGVMPLWVQLIFGDKPIYSGCYYPLNLTIAGFAGAEDSVKQFQGLGTGMEQVWIKGVTMRFMRDSTNPHWLEDAGYPYKMMDKLYDRTDQGVLVHPELEEALIRLIRPGSVLEDINLDPERWPADIATTTPANNGLCTDFAFWMMSESRHEVPDARHPNQTQGAE